MNGGPGRPSGPRDGGGRYQGPRGGRPGPTRSSPPRSGPPSSGPPRSGPPRPGGQRPGGPRPGGPRGGGRNTRGGPPVRSRGPRWHWIHRDDAVVVVDKPPGLPITLDPGEPKGRPNLLASVRRDMRDTGKRGLWIVQGMEPGACGLVLFVTNPDLRTALRDQARQGTLRRTLTAVVEGVPGADKAGTLRYRVLEHADGQVTPVEGAGMTRAELNRARDATTHYRVMETRNGRTLLQLRDETNRRGQLVAHLRAAGCPIIGDLGFKRGGHRGVTPRLALHCTEISFQHPQSGDTVRLRVDPPRGMLGLLDEPPPPPPATKPASRERTEPKPEPRTPVETTSTEVPEPREPVAAPWTPSTETAHAGHLEPIASETNLPIAPHPAAEPEPARAHTEDSGAAQPAKQDRIPPKAAAAEPADNRGWDHVAGWYDQVIDDRGSDLYEDVILPGTLGLLRGAEGSIRGKRVLDIACGQGVLARRLSGEGAEVVGVDAAPRLIEAAQRREEGPNTYHVAAARRLSATPLDERSFDLVACVMALMNIEPVAPVMRGAAALVRPGGAFVGVLLHPAFRAPKQTAWHWKPGRPERQVREVGAYLSHSKIPITMNPGEVAGGGEAVQTWTYHRPISSYVAELSEAGFLIEAIEEWPSSRRSEPGPRADEENRSRAEIPMFLAFRAVRTDER